MQAKREEFPSNVYIRSGTGEWTGRGSTSSFAGYSEYAFVHLDAILGSGEIAGTVSNDFIIGNWSFAFSQATSISGRSSLVMTQVDSPDQISGGGGDDTMLGGSGKNEIDGGEGDDSILAGSDDEILKGGAGNDTIENGGALDHIYGEGGDDYVTTNSGLVSSTFADGGQGNDAISGGGGIDSLHGGDGADRLNGGRGQDTLYGDAGEDRISGDIHFLYGNFETPSLSQDEADWLDGGDGADTLDGGYGHDTLLGGSNNDILDGDEGNDTLVGGLGNDVLRGNRGSDTLAGGAGNDSLTGGSDYSFNSVSLSVDYLDGGSDDDALMGAGTLLGGDGADTITAEAYRMGPAGSSLDGGAGADNFHIRSGSFSGLITVRGDGGATGAEAGFDRLYISDILDGMVRIREGTPAGTNGFTLSVNGIDRYAIGADVEFVSLGRSVLDNKSVDFGGSFYDDMARMARQAYEEKALNVDDQGLWTGESWRPVTALELGLRSSGGKTSSGLDYTMAGGIYRAEGEFGPDAAVAHIYAARGKILVSFRGTDIERLKEGDFSDLHDWFNLRSHYERFAPLIDALKGIAVTRPVGDEIFITGHSLGGAMAQFLYQDMISIKDAPSFSLQRIHAATFGSPGAINKNLSNLSGNSITQFEMTQDVVPFAEPFADLAGQIGEIIGGLPSLVQQAFGLEVASSSKEGEQYRKLGTVVRIADGASQDPGLGFQEHTADLYVEKVTALAKAISDGALQPDGGVVQYNGGRFFSGPPPGSETSYLSIVAGDGRIEADVSEITYSTGRYYRDGNDLIVGGPSADTLIGHAGDDTLVGVGGSDRFEGGSGSDTFVLSWSRGVGSILSDFMPGDSLLLRNMPVVSEVTAALETVNGLSTLTVSVAGHGNRSFALGTGSIISGRFEYRTGVTPIILGNGANDVQITLAGDLRIQSGISSDLLFGGTGDDTLDGGDGNDDLVGGTGLGDDLLIGGLGIDTVTYRSAIGPITVDLPTGVASSGTAGIGNDRLEGIEHVEGGNHSDSLTGDDAANRLAGFAGHDTLNGASGADTLVGGAGNDLLDGAGEDDLIEGGAGDDRIIGGSGQDTASYSSADVGVAIRLANGRATSDGGADTLEGIEHLRGSDFADSLQGNAEANRLEGNAGADSLEGGAADDTLSGGPGNDTLDGGEGTDIVVFFGPRASYEVRRNPVTHDLSVSDNSIARDGLNVVRANVEILRFSDADSAASNFIFVQPTLAISAISANKAEGHTGPTPFTFTVSRTGDTSSISSVNWSVTGDGATAADFARGVLPSGTVSFDAGETSTTLTVNVAGDLAFEADERFTVTLSGATGASISTITATGTIRNDDPSPVTLSPGNDTYAAVANEVHILALAGADSVVALGGANTLDGAAGQDSLVGSTGADSLSGGGDSDSLAGWNGSDTLLGGEGADTLDGGAGADSMAGGTGNDIYVLDQTGDMITEVVGEGLDEVQASITWTLSPNIERLVLTGSSVINGTGNALDNGIIGNARTNRLMGGDGADTLNGDGSADTLDGGNGHDLLDGGTGADSMAGGAGNDVYIVDHGNDRATEAVGEGTDEVRATVNWTLGENFERLVLTGTAPIDGIGNALNNTITGNAGDNILNGGIGNDSMAGGAGNDVYIVDHVRDVVTEMVDGGMDEVRASVTWTLGAHVERLLLTGASVIHGTGNALDNTITGNDRINLLTGGEGADTLFGGGSIDTLAGGIGDDLLNGGLGADSMAGGAGNDIYIVDHGSDVVVEAAGGGIDEVRATTNATLSAHVERLVLLGTGGIRGTGNELNNVITGNSGHNVLDGGGGADTLTGGAGRDTLIAGAGDLFVFEQALHGADSIAGFAAAQNDLVISAAGFGGGLAAGMDLIVGGRFISALTRTATSPAGVGQFILETDRNLLWWDADGSGGTAPVQITFLSNITGFGGDDIRVIA